ncbi:MAG TPA: TetR/AcrR family transcriptional regulator [Acetobacteraceae bacterium]|nr:TetR/AcrR family transcriptional regulator [Acetobacteraceae bacterium]
MNCFWDQGYELTSVRDLASQMGITGASLYNAFGDKRSLYRRALDHYLKRSVHDRIARCEQLAPVSAIRAFFDEIIERSVLDRKRRGCLLINSAVEVAPHDPEFRALAVAEFEALERFFRDRISAGQKEGAIAALQPPEVLAKTLLSVLLGIRVLARTRPQRAVLGGAVDGVLSLLAIDA